MYHIKEAIIVEGAYDKLKLAGFIDGTILTTHGFAVYTNPEFISLIKSLAKKDGIVIFTDSDSAGLRIRNFIKQHTIGGRVLHAYAPDIKGVEKRKAKPSSEGLLGVEGMDKETIINALKAAGCTIDDSKQQGKDGKITKADLYMLGLTGGENSSRLREALAREIGVPAKLSANMLLDVLNRLMTYNELKKLINNIF